MSTEIAVTAARRREYPAAPIVGVGAVVLSSDASVLLIRRGREPMLGAWTLPGGALELGETMAGAAAREVLEETGLRVDPVEIIATLDRILSDAAGRVRFHYVLVDWLCTVRLDEPGTPCCGDDAIEARWVERAGMEALGVDSVTLEVVDKALRRLRELGR